MGVTTTADDKLNSARDHVRSAIKDLAEIVIDECYGANEYTDEFLDELRVNMNDLLDLKNRLG